MLYIVTDEIKKSKLSFVDLLFSYLLYKLKFETYCLSSYNVYLAFIVHFIHWVA